MKNEIEAGDSSKEQTSSHREERLVVPLPRFSWKKCYGMHGREHWALCDAETDPRQVSCLEMILWDHVSADLDKKHMPKLIVDLLNEHFRHNAQRIAPTGEAWSATTKPPCKIFHRWTNIDGSKNRHSDQKCRRCGALRKYYGTGGWGCYGEPYAPKSEHDLKRSAEIANELVEEIWKLRNENAKLKATDCRVTQQEIADTMPPRVGWDI